VLGQSDPSFPTPRSPWKKGFVCGRPWLCLMTLIMFSWHVDVAPTCPASPWSNSIPSAPSPTPSVVAADATRAAFRRSLLRQLLPRPARNCAEQTFATASLRKRKDGGRQYDCASWAHWSRAVNTAPRRARGTNRCSNCVIKLPGDSFHIHVRRSHVLAKNRARFVGHLTGCHGH
jgi:hypothetical protein